MKRLFKSACALTILALWAAPARAAEKMVAEEGAVEVVLLRQQSIQKELKLSADEVEKIHKYAAQQWEKAQKIHEESGEMRDKKFKEMSKENEAFVEKTLTKDQLKRLHEITLQTAGILCLTRPAVASKLKLTEDQKKKAHQLQKEARREAEEFVHATKKEEKRTKMRELQETSRKDILELLTDEQEITWKQMTGAPFTGDLAFFDPDSTGNTAGK
jgi:hypothetical protein